MLPRIIGWKASDGRMFEIDTVELKLKTMEDVQDHIAKLRKEHGYPDPTFMSVLDPKGHLPTGSAMNTQDLPEHMRKRVEDVINDMYHKQDPKKTN